MVLDQLKERAKKSQDTLEDEKLFWKICSSSYQELLQHYINYDIASEVDKWTDRMKSLCRGHMYQYLA